MVTINPFLDGDGLDSNTTESLWPTNTSIHHDFLDTYGNKTGVQSQTDSLEFGILMVNLVLSLGATLSNGAILLASKFTTGGDTPALIYVRSFCFADCMVGVYGLLKVAFILGQPQWINCFICESILFSALTASNFMLVNFSTNTLMHLIKPHMLNELMDKKITITNMVFLWNGAFLIGFAPLMGWHLTESGCKFFTYYDIYYILFMLLIFLGCSISTQVFLIRVKNVLSLSQPKTFQHRDFARIQRVLLTCRLDLCGQFLSQFPLAIYMLLNCHVCALYDINSYPDLVLLFFIPPILTKSVVAAAVHGSRTTQIWQVLTSFILGHLLQLRQKHMNVQRKYSDHPRTDRQKRQIEKQPPHGISIVSIMNNSRNHRRPSSAQNSFAPSDVSDEETIETIATPRGSIGSCNSLEGLAGMSGDQTTNFMAPIGSLNSKLQFSRDTNWQPSWKPSWKQSWKLPWQPFWQSAWQPCPVHRISVISPSSSSRSSVDFTSASMVGCQNHHHRCNLDNLTSAVYSSTTSSPSSTYCESKCVQIHSRSCPAHPQNLKMTKAQTKCNYKHAQLPCNTHSSYELSPNNSKKDSRQKYRKSQNKTPSRRCNGNYLSPAILSAHNLSEEDLAKGSRRNSFHKKLYS